MLIDSLVSSYLGETTSRIEKMFASAAANPCVFFLDEFESFGKERCDEHENGEIKRITARLLTLIETLPSSTLLIGATNHPEMLDKAAWRRFQMRLALPLPDREAMMG